MKTRTNHHSQMVTFIEDRILEYKNQIWLAVTLTFKQGLPRPNCTIEQLDYDQLSRTVGQIIKALNRIAFGSACRRHKLGLMVVPVIEQGQSGRLHVHMLLQVPRHFFGRLGEFSTQVRTSWQKMRWAHSQGDIRPLIAQSEVVAWTKYILKEHLHTEDALDHRNLKI